jgi:hypothetical protein
MQQRALRVERVLPNASTCCEILQGIDVDAG